MKKILFITPALPAASDSGGAHRSRYLLTELQKVADVHVCTCAPDGIDHDKASAFSRHTTYLGNIPLPRKFSFSLKDHDRKFPLMETLRKRNYDHIFVRYLHSAYWLKLLQEPNLILDCDDCQLEILQQIREQTWGLPRILAKSFMKRFEPVYQSSISRIPRVIFSKQSAMLPPAPNMAVIPNRILAPAVPPARSNDQTSRRARPVTVLFVGYLGYAPNFRGLDEFIKRSWPSIVKEIPDIRLKVVGAGLPGLFARRWSRAANVELCGFVPNLEDVYADVDFCISPISVGSGTHIKILESLGRGLTMVISKRSHRGFEEALKDGESLHVAQDFEDFAKKVCDLARNTQLRESFSARGRQVVNQSFAYDRSTPSVFADLVACQSTP
jgi:glycosyltransferase involved in cell wall biosynthesis